MYVCMYVRMYACIKIWLTSLAKFGATKACDSLRIKKITYANTGSVLFEHERVFEHEDAFEH